MAASSCRMRPLSRVFCARTLPGMSAPLQFVAGVHRQAPSPSHPGHPCPPPQPHPHLLSPACSNTSWLCVGSPRAPRHLATAAASGGGAWAPPLTLRSLTRAASASSAAAAPPSTAPSEAASREGNVTAVAKVSRQISKRRRQQQPGVQHAGKADSEDAVLLIGFHPEEVDIVRQQLPDVVHLVDDAAGDAGGGSAATSLVDVTSNSLPYTVSEVLERRRAATAAAAAAVDGAAAVSAGRVVLLVGPVARALGAQLNDLLAEWGVVPALIAAYQPAQHAGMPLGQLVTFLRDAHAAYYSLLQPVLVEPLPEAAAAGDHAAATAAAADATASSSEAAADHLRVLEDVRVVMSVAMDAGEVPSIHGEYRRDAGHVVVLDGLLTEAERGRLLDWLTAPGHCHAGPPPEDKWEMVCVDREGARPTWGLQPQVLQALRDDPPPPVVALQTRLAALYPEYDICHMPAEHISDGYGSRGADGDGDDTPLSPFVGNAVMAQDPCAWHSDADPTTVPPHSPWVHNFGYYHNRELGRPLFVTMLLYLNDVWPEDYHAETLFLDPETQLGLFVRPQPGRVVLMEQDLPHRISAPSLEAPGPRYSLVWKLVLVPRRTGPAANDSDCRRYGGDGNDDPGRESGSSAGLSPSPAADGGRERWGGCVAPGAEFQSICRPEWGEPVRIGTANRHCGVPAFRRDRQGAPRL